MTGTETERGRKGEREREQKTERRGWRGAENRQGRTRETIRERKEIEGERKKKQNEDQNHVSDALSPTLCDF